MDYAKYIIINSIASIKRETELLSNYDFKNDIPDFLKYNDIELKNVISELEIKKQELINALNLLNNVRNI